jgi:4-hydroxybenzoate polyprenyltransferase
LAERLKAYFSILRPSHWSKNVFVFMGLIFGGKLFGPGQEVLLDIGHAVGGFIFFCIAASGIYILNDIIDRKVDRLHPTKSKRPIAAGEISVISAIALALLFVIASVGGSFILARGFGIIVVMYIVLMILYSVFLKTFMILDCVVLAIGFCLRAVSGAVLVNVSISPWLVICTFALSMFLAFGKRRGEIAALGENSSSFRRTLSGYTPELLAHMLDVTSGLSIVCFLLYATDERTLGVFGNNNLVYTTPVVLYCVFRFSALIQKGKFAGPVELILHDLPFQIGFLLWVVLCVLIIYADKLGISFPNVLTS